MHTSSLPYKSCNIVGALYLGLNSNRTHLNSSLNLVRMSSKRVNPIQAHSSSNYLSNLSINNKIVKNSSSKQVKPNSSQVQT